MTCAKTCGLWTPPQKLNCSPMLPIINSNTVHYLDRYSVLPSVIFFHVLQSVFPEFTGTVRDIKKWVVYMLLYILQGKTYFKKFQVPRSKALGGVLAQSGSKSENFSCYKSVFPDFYRNRDIKKLVQTYSNSFFCPVVQF